MRKALLGVALALWLVPTAQAAVRTRLLYSSAWTGVSQVYALDPSSGKPPAQLTFGRPGGCDPLVASCGHGHATAAPNGRWIAYTEYTGDCGGLKSLFVANADGRNPRSLGQGTGCDLDYAWSPDSKRIAYVVGSTIVVVRIDGSRITQLPGRQPAWSPDSRSLAFLPPFDQPGRALGVWRAGRVRVVARDVSDFAWSPTGKWIAVGETTSDPYSNTVKLVSPNGAGERQLAPDYALEFSWSHDGQLLAYYGHEGLEVVSIATGAVTHLGSQPGAHSFRWSRRGHVLTFDGLHGLELYDADTQSRRNLISEHGSQIVWSPDDRSVAFVVDMGWPMFFGGDVQIAATASGRVRTVLHGSGDFGGYAGGLSWTVPSGKPRYRLAVPRHAAIISPLELEAPWPIGRLVADGRRVAYTTCGRLFVWTPATGSLTQPEPDASLTPKCSTPGDYDPFEIYDLALAGDRLALGGRDGNMVQRWLLFQETLDAPGRLQQVASGGGYAGCTVGPSGLGDLVGSGDLVVFSRWEEGLQPAQCGVALKQAIYRLDPGGCPCPEIASSPGPLQPADVNQGRIVAFGTNATVILDRNGTQLLTVPVAARAAQLSGSQLVVLVQGQLREYEATSGALLHASSLPNVTAGGLCGSPHPWSCLQAGLKLQDVAAGRAVYVLDGRVHVLRLGSSADTTVGAGTIARFMDDGLVYADGARIHLVPFSQLERSGF